MISLVVLDDVPEHIDLLKRKLDQICAEHRLDASVALTTENAQEVVDFARANVHKAVYFLDIALEQKQNGIEICKTIQALDANACVVYVSAYSNYALECCKSHAFDFLLKPFSDAELLDCLMAATRHLEAAMTDGHITLSIGSRTILLRAADVTHITVRRNVLTAYTDGEKYSWRGNFPELLASLDPDVFIQIRRNCIVNIKRIREIDWSDDTIRLDTDILLPIARRAKKHMWDALLIKG